jgi:excisionase family DNA binding protein
VPKVCRSACGLRLRFMARCTAMKPPTPRSSARLIAESVRAQLGTEAVVLITPGTPSCAVVIAQGADTPACQADTAAELDSDSSSPHHDEKLAYSVAEAARALSLSNSLIYDQLRTGRLGSMKVGRRRIITREQIDKFLAGRF